MHPMPGSCGIPNVRRHSSLPISTSCATTSGSSREAVVQMTKTKAIILAAGQGTRLGALTANCPKCMIELWGRPLLHHQIDALRGCGVEDITIVGGYQVEKLAPQGCRVRVNPDFATTNMVHT